MAWKLRIYNPDIAQDFRLFTERPTIEQAQKSVISQEVDSFSFGVKCDYTDDAIFDVDSLVEVFYEDDDTGDETRWFLGRLIRTPRSGKPASESIGYEIAGLWYFLEQCTYQQIWKSYDISGAIVHYAQSHLLLNCTQTGAIMSQKAQLNDALDWCIASNVAEFGFPLFQYVNNIADFFVPRDEATDIRCSEVIKRMLRFCPDAVTWFDYTTTPPTLYIDRRSNLQAVTKDCSDSECEGNQIVDRTDLQVPAVVLKFERTVDINGSASNLLDVRVWPDDGITAAATSGLTYGTDAYIAAISAACQTQPYLDLVTAKERLTKALVATVSLRGTTITTVQGYLLCQTIAPTTQAWWITKYPWLADATEFTVISGSVAYSGSHYANEILDGAAAEWMTVSGSPVTVAPVVITAKVSYKLKDKDGNITAERQYDTLSAPANSTNGTTGSYSTGSTDVGDLVPEGLVKVIYDSTNALQYDGTEEFNGVEVDGSVSVGNVLNISGGRTEWATMRALVQSITENIDTGRTTVKIGPAKHLGQDDIIEWMRFNRARITFTPLASRTGGTPTSSVLMGRNTSKTGATNAAGNQIGFQIFGSIGDQTLTGDARPVTPILKVSGSRLQLGEPAILAGDTTVKQLDINATDIATAKVLKVRTMTDGSQVVCSADFTGGGGGDGQVWL